MKQPANARVLTILNRKKKKRVLAVEAWYYHEAQEISEEPTRGSQLYMMKTNQFLRERSTIHRWDN
jgi:hypothetical protein